jgi:hypothetical protein
MSETPYIDLAETFPCVPFGRIEPASNFHKNSKEARKLGKLPVLSGLFSPAKVNLSGKQQMHLGFGSMGAPGMSMPMLTFRLQIGADMLYWLANPWDPEVWAMVDAWDATGRMAVAAEVGDTVLFMTRDYEIIPPMRELRKQAQSSMKRLDAVQEFMQGAGLLAVSGHLALGATTDIPSIPSLRHVQGCTVQTETTGRVLVPHEIAALAACDLIMPSGGQVHHPRGHITH